MCSRRGEQQQQKKTKQAVGKASRGIQQQSKANQPAGHLLSSSRSMSGQARPGLDLGSHRTQPRSGRGHSVQFSAPIPPAPPLLSPVHHWGWEATHNGARSREVNTLAENAFAVPRHKGAGTAAKQRSAPSIAWHGGGAHHRQRRGTVTVVSHPQPKVKPPDGGGCCGCWKTKPAFVVSGAMVPSSSSSSRPKYVSRMCIAFL